MKNLFTIFKFELSNFIENKTYVISTALIAILIAVVMFLPNFIDLGLNDNKSDNSTVSEDNDSSDTETDDSDKSLEIEVTDSYKYIIFDESKEFVSIEELNNNYKDSEADIGWKEAKSVDEVKKAVESEEYDSGYVIKSRTEYDSYVYNKEMFDFSDSVITNIMTLNFQKKYCEENNLDFNKVQNMINTNIKCEEHVLGKNASDSYWYCYAFVIVIFMLIIIYGVMIATAVTSEKSNRSIEVLVTSTPSEALLFGKVLAGTVASFLQIAIILLVAIGGYKINESAWGHALDMILKIDTKVLVTFAIFGITGFVFYAFIYGAVGALVSKTEDINKSAGSVQMIIMIVYFVVLFQMSNIDGIVMKVASFLPISSYSAMFIRVAMGEVALWEIIVSYIILIVSTVLVGILGAKIYRMGTLRYGNPIKISTALKSLNEKD